MAGRDGPDRPMARVADLDSGWSAVNGKGLLANRPSNAADMRSLVAGAVRIWAGRRSEAGRSEGGDGWRTLAGGAEPVGQVSHALIAVTSCLMWLVRRACT